MLQESNIRQCGNAGGITHRVSIPCETAVPVEKKDYRDTTGRDLLV